MDTIPQPKLQNVDKLKNKNDTTIHIFTTHETNKLNWPSVCHIWSTQMYMYISNNVYLYCVQTSGFFNQLKIH